MSANPRKAALVTAVLVAGTMLMTACQESDSNSGAAKGSSAAPPASQPVVTPPAPPASSTTGGNQGGGNDSAGKTAPAPGTPAKSSGGQGTTGTTGGSGSADDGKCKTDNLRVDAIDATIGGDAERSVAVSFKNLAKDCTMSGFAGVDLKTNAGTVSATRTGAPADRFVLTSGKSVSFYIAYPANETGGSGVRITDLLVTPPGETKIVTLDWPGAGSLPATDGTGSPVKVGPIGSAGQGGEQG